MTSQELCQIPDKDLFPIKVVNYLTTGSKKSINQSLGDVPLVKQFLFNVVENWSTVHIISWPRKESRQR